ncbi:MAG: hypothetical protein M3P51_08700, partial [Chloroflexota bacterium]|nr:hypothetical protein [Chloroflexota bacterium]
MSEVPALALAAAAPQEFAPSADLAQPRPTVVPTERRVNAAAPTVTKAARASSNTTRTADTNLLLPDLRALPPH